MTTSTKNKRPQRRKRDTRMLQLNMWTRFRNYLFISDQTGRPPAEDARRRAKIRERKNHLKKFPQFLALFSKLLSQQVDFKMSSEKFPRPSTSQRPSVSQPGSATNSRPPSRPPSRGTMSTPGLPKTPDTPRKVNRATSTPPSPSPSEPTPEDLYEMQNADTQPFWIPTTITLRYPDKWSKWKKPR